MAFAKLFGSDDSQVLVMLGKGDDDCPELSVLFKPEGFGVCKLCYGFEDSDDGWDKAEAAFEEIDEAKARVAVDAVLLKIDLKDKIKH